MEMREFIDACCCVMQAYPGIMRLDDENWQQWGLSVIAVPQLMKFDIPNPMDHAEWKDWARGLVVALQSATEAPGRGTH